MKVVHLSTTNGKSGAGIAAFRIHRALQQNGVDSRMLVRHNYQSSTAPNEVVELSNRLGDFGKKLLPHIDKLPNRLYPKKDPALFSPAWWENSKLIDQINKLSPDLIHIHWVNFGFLKIEQLRKIQVPIVWTMHDNWLFTGGCHIMWNCDRYLDQCGACPRLKSQRPNDLSRSVWLRKRNTFDQLDDFHLVAPSHWLKECASKSSLLHNFSTSVVPNPIDCSMFRPLAKQLAKKKYQLDPEKRVILFGALDALGDQNKGYDLLIQALQGIDLSNAQLLIFGSDTPMRLPVLDCPIEFIGQLNEEKELVNVYSAADLMIVPSRQEAFGQTAAEAMACETPVVAFRHSGLRDIVDHLENGYLAEPFEVGDLGKGISYLLKADPKMGTLARQKVKSNFDPDLVAKKYLQLYRQIQ